MQTDCLRPQCKCDEKRELKPFPIFEVPFTQEEAVVPEKLMQVGESNLNGSCIQAFSGYSWLNGP
ncbi:hypothetical protein D5072_14955 [Dickeya dianthicola]|nr:hypothetical protein D5072_14955 [Dickeya dianthicola]